MITRAKAFFLIVGLLVPFAEGQQPDELDFRTVVAPPEIHVLETPKLVQMLNLGQEQSIQVNGIVRDWKSEYRKKKKVMDSLPPDDQVSRIGWPPARDRDLRESVANLLDEKQLQRFNEFSTLWKDGPVHTNEAFRHDRAGELQLTDKQHVGLHKLNTRWVLDSYPKFANRFEYSKPGQRISRALMASRLRERKDAITELAVKFTPERDKTWTKLLSPYQVKRWREIALQTIFLRYGFRVLLEHAGARQHADHLSSESTYKYLVPYFRSPVKVIDWSGEQLEAVRAIIEVYDAGQPAERPRDREGWSQYRTAKRARQRQSLAKIEAVMTVEQRQRWRDMLGKPHSLVAKEVFENEQETGQ